MPRWKSPWDFIRPSPGRSAEPEPQKFSEFTNPAPAPPDFKGSKRLEIFRRLLGSLEGQTYLDLGAGHGAFSLIGRDLGWDVTAVDARIERYPRREGVRWLQSDVREFDPTGFDVVGVLGLLYHLEFEDQVDLITKCAGQTLIIDTHTAEHPAVELSGYTGQLFVEKTSANTASWDNELSFWPTEESLIRMLQDNGHPFVFKLDPPYYPHRNFYLCTPTDR